MADGIAAHSDVLAAVLPRVSSEAVVVAFAAHGLIAHSGKQGTAVHMEGPIGGDVVGRSDLSVHLTGDGLVAHFEWKCIWAGSVARNARGIHEDLEKLARAGVSNGFAVGFAYTLNEAPNAAPYRSAKSIEAVVADAKAAVDADVAFASTAFDLRGPDTSGRACIIAWGV